MSDPRQISNPDNVPGPSPLAEKARSYFEGLQRTICSALEEIDRRGKFNEDHWDRPEGGGGITRVFEEGLVFEKAGVNTSTVFGKLPDTLAAKMQTSPTHFLATGISLVLHPRSPKIPTVHANFRYFEKADGDAWFGGGADLTPYYPFEDDVRHFHRVFKSACDLHGADLYPRFKKWCDEYFFIKHRKEARGVGGLFFDYLRGDLQQHFAFVQSVADVFLEAYTPIVNKRIHEPWGDRERDWQLYRRGRYAEFNLVYDRGTLFGLETNGRVESILMSLPPVAHWRYNVKPDPGSPEALLLDYLSTPREWT